MKKIFSLILTLCLFILILSTPISVSAQETAELPAPQKVVYVLAAPFTTLTDEVSFADFQKFWSGSDYVFDRFPTDEITVIASDQPSFVSQFGETNVNRVTFETEFMVATGQAVRLEKWLILPFDQLDARFKVIAIDGQNPLHHEFDADQWPLTLRLNGTESMTEADWSAIQPSNRDPEKLTNIMMTGVTALVRAVEGYMYVWGTEYPATNIGDTLRAADILHINNEIPFAPNCSQTDEELDRLVFCSKPERLELLTSIGTDVIELAGDHFQDYGDSAVYYTLDLYDDAGIPYYGGGRTLEEAQKPLLIEHNGNKFAFLGCNAKEIGYAVASETRPGAAHCDLSLLTAQIKDAKAAGYMPIVTFQHIEYYRVSPNEEMRESFNAAVDAGAVITSGSQSHIPMAFSINKKSFTHFGLGNLFFDQAFYLPETGEATLDRHVFYNNRHISTEVLTIKFINNALSRFMTKDERTAMLERIFNESTIQ